VTAQGVVAQRRTKMLLVYGDNLHRELDANLAAKATIIINRTSNAMIKTPWQERETREALDQISTELSRTKVMIIPFSEQVFHESPVHELLNCPHPGCLNVRDFQGELDLKQTRIDELEQEAITILQEVAELKQANENAQIQIEDMTRDTSGEF
jgi:hypothetical protein